MYLNMLYFICSFSYHIVIGHDGTSIIWFLSMPLGVTVLLIMPTSCNTHCNSWSYVNTYQWGSAWEHWWWPSWLWVVVSCLVPFTANTITVEQAKCTQILLAWHAFFISQTNAIADTIANQMARKAWHSEQPIFAVPQCYGVCCYTSFMTKPLASLSQL